MSSSLFQYFETYYGVNVALRIRLRVTHIHATILGESSVILTPNQPPTIDNCTLSTKVVKAAQYINLELTNVTDPEDQVISHIKVVGMYN